MSRSQPKSSVALALLIQLASCSSPGADFEPTGPASSGSTSGGAMVVVSGGASSGGAGIGGSSSSAGASAMAGGGAAGSTGGSGALPPGSVVHVTARPSAACGVAPAPADGAHTLQVGDVERELVLHVPATYDGKQALPLVLGFHGKGDLAKNLDGANFKFQSVGGANNVLVYPQALPDPALQNASSFERDIADDLRFYDALVTWLNQNVCFDTARQFAIGHSLGSTFVQALACSRQSSLRAMATQAGDLGPTMGCQGPVAAWIGYGVQDSPGELGASRARKDFWMTADHCDAASMSPGTPAPPCILYGCASGAPVEWCEEELGTHKWSAWMSQSVFDFFGLFVAP